MTDHEALEALVKIAGEIPISAYPGKSYGERSHNAVTMVETLIDLSKSLRTGQLIPAPSVDDAMVERVARAIYKADTEDQNHSTRPQLDLSSIDLDQWYDENAAMTLSGPGFVQRHRALAIAAISAMQVKP